MVTGLYSALSGLQASQALLDVSANNVANVNTPGFKSGSIVQTSAPSQELSPASSNKPLGTSVGLGTQVDSVSTNYASGGLINTGNPNDLSINGSGFFEVVAPNGGTYFTRNGDFLTDSQGFLRTPEGAYLSAGGSAVQIPQNAVGYSVGSDGRVVASYPDGSSSQLGQIDLASFSNENGLVNTGGGLYEPTAASGNPSYANPGSNGVGTIQQGYLEASNTDVVQEMVNQTVSLDSFMANAKVIQSQNEANKALRSIFS